MIGLALPLLLLRVLDGFTPVPAKDLGGDAVIDDFAQLPQALADLKLL